MLRDIHLTRPMLENLSSCLVIVRMNLCFLYSSDPFSLLYSIKSMLIILMVSYCMDELLMLVYSTISSKQTQISGLCDFFHQELLIFCLMQLNRTKPASFSKIISCSPCKLSILDNFFLISDLRVLHFRHCAYFSVEGAAGGEYRPTSLEDPSDSAKPASRRNTAEAISGEETSVVLPLLSDKKKMAAVSGPTGPGGSKLEHTPSGVDIMIGLEDEAGSAAPVEIDEADDIIRKEEPGEWEKLISRH